MLRFAGFELDQRRIELRAPGGEPIRLRPKSFDMLRLFAANAGRVVSKQELMEAIWPNIHVGEDSLFQCIREIRTALGDEGRQLIKVVSGRGYLFDAEVSGDPASFAASAGLSSASEQEGLAQQAGGHAAATVAGPAKKRQFSFGLRSRVAAVIAVLCAVIGFAVAAPMFAPGVVAPENTPTITVMPFVDGGSDPQATSMATNVTDRLADGLAKIDTIRVVTPRSDVTTASLANAPTRPADTDFVVSGELQRSANSWTLEARMTNAATGEVKWTTSVAVDTENTDLALQQSRLAAGVGHELAVRINAVLYPRAGVASPLTGSTKVVVEQALASINQTTRERFTAAQTMLESALANAPDNLDLQVTPSALQTRGIQMNWYSAAESTAAESAARSRLERALQAKPNYLPGLEAYCRFLTATNNFVESLVACAKVLSLDPWNGSALYQLGLTQIQLGRFDDALANFKQADRFDTPAVSRWTWLLGIGWANLLLGHSEEAVPWLQKSIAITPASGRPYMVLAVALQGSGRTDEAKAALAKAMVLRPGSTALNVAPPKRNASPVFLEAGQRFIRTLVELGLPAG